jgi:hypothetical protein
VAKDLVISIVDPEPHRLPSRQRHPEHPIHTTRLAPTPVVARKMSYPAGRVGFVEDRLAVLSEARPYAMSSVELVAAFDAAQALAVELDAVRLGLIREIDVRGVAKGEGASSTAVWIRNRHRVGIRSAHRLVTLAAELDGAPPVVGEAVAAGEVNRDQVEVVLRSLARLPRDIGPEIRDRAAAALVGFCADHDPAQLGVIGERILHVVAPEEADEAERRALERAEATATEKRFFTLSPHPDGVGVRLAGRLTAAGAAAVRAAIEPLLTPTPGDDRSAGQRRADALVEVCQLALRTENLPDHGGSRPQIVLGVDFDVLKQELGAGTLDNGDQVTPETVRRMGCDAHLLPVVFRGRSMPLDVARTRRLVAGALRQALAARDRGCAFPDCDRDQRWCDAHHVRHWSMGGPTALNNVVLLCPHHHAEIHRQNNWTVFIDTDGLPTFIPPKHVDPEQKPRRNKYHRRP